jgi:serine/threonine protein kinase
MERIYGCSIGDIVYGTDKVPDNYDHRKFFTKLKENIKKMHENNIHHRDLHEGNVMIDQNGDPVIIDFGTACMAFSGDEHPYGEKVRMFNEGTGRYEFREGYFKDDERMLYQLDLKMREFARNVGAY